jgi:predicted nuclease of predicted toxin-antitoxin system
MKILVDMNLSPDWIQMFADQNIEALHWSSVGDARASDSTILQWAKEQGYVVFTNDLDFGAILVATQANAPSVIQLRTQDLLPNKIGTVVI